MKKILIIWIIFLFLISTIVGYSKPITQDISDSGSSILFNVDGSILYVGGNGPNNYTKIQDAINDSNNGDTVFVFNGTYYEHIDIYKSIVVLGEDRDTTVIQANETDYCVIMSANNVNISGFTLNRGAINIESAYNIIHNNQLIIDTGQSGIYISGFSYHSNDIINNIIIGAGRAGFESYFSSNNRVIGNNISGFYRGIKFFESSNNFISENILEENGAGIFLWGTQNSVVTKNTILNNSLGGFPYGIWLMGSYSATITNNTIKGCSHGISFQGAVLTEVRDNVIADSYNRGIYGSLASHVTFSGNNIAGSRGHDMELEEVDNLTIENNFISKGITFGPFIEELERWNTHTINNNFASNGPIRYYKNLKDVVVPTYTAQVILANCSYFTIQHLNLSNVWNGIQLGYSSHNIISENIYHGGNENPHSDHGINLIYSDYNLIFDNYIYDSSHALFLIRSCNKNVISGNQFFDNGHDIDVYASCVNNFIIWNDFIGNYRNICFYDQSCSSKNNIVHHNNFITSQDKILNYGDNIWDDGYPSGGNYWDDYTGEDNNGDGIGDEPYFVTDYHGNVTGEDRYPQMDQVTIDNIPPVIINVSGPRYGRPLIEYVFCAEAVDSERNAMFYKWEWGDGTSSNWIGPGYSWETMCTSHIWQEDGIYEINVIIRDVAGFESSLSVPLVITIEDASPDVQIIKPGRGIYINNYRILPRLFRICLVIGDVDIIVNASDELSGIERVDFYIDGKLKTSVDQEPYVFRWEKDRIRFFIHSHVIKIVAYDNAGNTAKDVMAVRRFF